MKKKSGNVNITAFFSFIANFRLMLYEAGTGERLSVITYDFSPLSYPELFYISFI